MCMSVGWVGVRLLLGDKFLEKIFDVAEQRLVVLGEYEDSCGVRRENVHDAVLDF